MYARISHLGVLATASVLIGVADTLDGSVRRHPAMMCKVLTRPEDVDADLVRARGRDLDLLDLERLACAPADGGLAGNGLSCGVRHGGREREKGRVWSWRECLILWDYVYHLRDS